MQAMLDRRAALSLLLTLPLAGTAAAQTRIRLSGEIGRDRTPLPLDTLKKWARRDAVESLITWPRGAADFSLAAQ